MLCSSFCHWYMNRFCYSTFCGSSSGLFSTNSPSHFTIEMDSKSTLSPPPPSSSSSSEHCDDADCEVQYIGMFHLRSGSLPPQPPSPPPEVEELKNFKVSFLTENARTTRHIRIVKPLSSDRASTSSSSRISTPKPPKEFLPLFSTSHCTTPLPKHNRAVQPINKSSDITNSHKCETSTKIRQRWRGSKSRRSNGHSKPIKSTQFKSKRIFSSKKFILKSNVQQYLNSKENDQLSFSPLSSPSSPQFFGQQQPDPILFEFSNMRYSITCCLEFESNRVQIQPYHQHLSQVLLGGAPLDRLTSVVDKLTKWAELCRPDPIEPKQNKECRQLLSTHFVCLQSLLTVLIEQYKEHQQSNYEGRPAQRNLNCVHSLYSMSIINFWNALECYNRILFYGNGTLRSLCGAVQCPDWILDTRNALSHCNRNPPSLELLNSSVSFALQWMDRYFLSNIRLRPLADALNGVLLCYEFPFDGMNRFTIRERILFPPGIGDTPGTEDNLTTSSSSSSVFPFAAHF